jgi:hypothetical protein
VSPDAAKPLPPIQGLLPARVRVFDGLDDFEPFEFWMPERERLSLASLLVGSAELPGLGPGAEIFLRRHVVCDE